MKVTIKHFLNAKVALRILDSNTDEYANDKVYHPVYIQISFGRKTTQIRSFTREVLTVEDFENYKKGNYKELFKEHSNDSDRISIKNLIREPTRVKKSIELLLEKRSHKKFEDIRYDVEALLVPMDEGLIDNSWSYMVMVNKRFDAPLSERVDIALSRMNTLTENIAIIKRKSGFDLSDCFPKAEITFWENVNTIIDECKKRHYLFIDFVLNYKDLIHSSKTICNKKEFIDEIEGLINYSI